MRQEILSLVDNAVQLATKNWEVWSKAGQDNTLNVQYLDKQSYYMVSLNKCLEKNKEIKEAYAGSAGSLVICWDDNTTKHNIVIEICLYAPLVAVYTYGNAPVAILDNIDKCLEELQLIKLTEDEITSLEQNNFYHFIF